MKTVFLDYRNVSGHANKMTLLLGNFDGVHLGHQRLVLEGKKATEGDLGVLLFDGNPADYFDSGKSHQVLTSLEDKLRLFASLGIDVAYVLHIDQDFFALSAEEYVIKVLKPLNPSLLVVGSDYTFGRGAAGNASLLGSLFPVREVPLLDYKGKKASTQRIISALGKGDLSAVAGQLGRDYEIHGTVGHGFGNGRKIGFPTANLELNTPYVLPKDGVYAGLAFLRGRPYPTLINVGDNPTVGLLRHARVECYLKGFAGSCYGETIYVQFQKRLRDEKQFTSLEELKEQITKDVASLD
jgi:riboflavin kinase/FMN adenylyltransferase